MSDQNDNLVPPKAIGLQGNRDSVATSASADPSFKAHESGSAVALPVNELPRGESEKPKRGKRPLVLAAVGLAALAVIVVAVIVPVYYKVIKPKNNSAESSNGGGNSGGNPSGNNPSGGDPTNNAATWGGDGSTITKEDGSTFTYNNKFGGFWVYDPTNPFNNSARAQSWSPPLSEEWKYGEDHMRGVNLGGWLVLEPFISPALYEPYQPSAPGYGGIHAIDEWTLCQAIAANSSSGGVAKVIEEHYATFITEEDFAKIAAAGLNWVRIPIPYWAVEKFPEEPFLERVAWKYFLKAIEWSRKYGLRINLDLHTIPGSQNGFNHSGKRGQVNWMHGVMGVANAQRSLNIIRSITEFISQDQYKNIVPFFGVVNEAQTSRIGIDTITSFYIEMHDMMRNITGLGKGPFISVHDGFQPLERWVDFMPGSDRVALDSHPYFAFSETLDSSPLAQQVTRPCSRWGARFNGTMDTYGFAAAGEWSLAFNDCGLYLNGASSGYRYDGTLPSYTGPAIGSCDPWLDASNWDDTVKENLKQFALAHMDAFQNYFFWTWKIGASLATGKVNSPLWSYSHGLENGYMPTDPREAAGVCRNSNPRAGPLKPSQTSYVSQTIAAAVRSAHPFPPVSLADQANAAALPTYTATGTPVTMPAPTFASATASVGSGWVGGSGGWEGDYVPVQGCTYPDPWDAETASIPGACTGSRRRLVREPRMTPPPVAK
ncbi:Cellulase (glycosyl hydrolase family 5 protein) [Rhizoctonia solani]|uniref:glucan 1,3-beta-glucosidase n=2 Tax=Rhizoctonia solani TaxID=456999 RepID=A0A8H8SVG5_9AGAM|nr:Cellulase (glycosyl hydrolase family 5 protein) [Rhizoctonia solani]QRW18432.1 Cellulase (glycosyl hydrolase family 5 protein) [Rhizoctonia solani]